MPWSPPASVVVWLEDIAAGCLLTMQVLFPDSRRLLYPFKPSEMHHTSLHTVQLNTNLIISHGTWTGMKGGQGDRHPMLYLVPALIFLDPSAVEVCLVKKFTPDIVQEHEQFSLLCELAAGRKMSGRGGSTPSLAHPEDRMDKDGGVLVLGDIVRVTVHPQTSLSKGYNVFGS